MDFRVTPSRIRDATLTVPGDKSISHRALMLGSIADGTTRVTGFLAGEDCLATLAAMRALGVDIEQPARDVLVIRGVGREGLRPPNAALDLGNSGTAIRLMAGLLAGQPFGCVLTGDESLRARPMARIITPLSQMGADIGSHNGRPPLAVRGGRTLTAIDYEMPVASAQVKSSILLAGLYADGTTSVTEPAITRDHTERMLRTMGGTVTSTGRRVSIGGGQALQGCQVDIPADLSSAAFLILAALLAENAEIVLTGIGVNPTRTGVIEILKGMGGDIEIQNPRRLGDEPVADIRVRSSELTGGPIDPGLVSLAIDEFPVLFVAAASARGTTVFSGLEELRVKESDRIAAMSEGLRQLGIRVDETPDGAAVTGGRFTGGDVHSFGDHRVAMSLAVAGTVAGSDVTIRGVENVDTSFPGFRDCFESVGGDIAIADGS